MRYFIFIALVLGGKNTTFWEIRHNKKRIELHLILNYLPTISTKISWKSGRVDNYLDENSNASKYSRKIITTYSKKKKLTKQNELNKMMDNPDKTNTQSGIHK